MNIPDKAVIWRDAQSAEVFHVGIGLNETGRFCWWFSLVQDGINDCFGQEACALAKSLKPGKPVPLKDVLDSATA